MRTSKYRATEGEANFGRPISTQVVGGTHITFELITKKGRTFYMTRWPKGLPRHEDPPNVLRFPHGLIRFGESLKECAIRLVREQLGIAVKDVKIAYWDAYLDKLNHWHIEPGCIVEVTGEPRIPKQASEIVSFDINHLPEMSFWSKADFLTLIREHLPELLPKK
jgi:8-oxo-dGTP pyrophosphatase MutT (NUDIX family)